MHGFAAAALIFVELLGHEDFRVREASQHNLYRLSELAYPVIRHAELYHRDAEVRVRCRQVCRRVEQRAAPWLAEVLYKPANVGGWPWFWVTDLCSWEGAFQMSRDYLAIAYSTGHGYTAPGYAAWREATRLYIVGMVSTRQPEWMIRRVVAELVLEHLDWLAKHK